MPPAVVAPPPTPAEPVTETLHGVEVTDPYRWLEDQNSPRTRAWIDEQTAYTSAYFDAIPSQEQIRERVKEVPALKEAIPEPRNFGDRYFFMKRQGNGEQPVIVAKDGLSGPERILVDPADRGLGKSMAVGIVAVSEYGRFLAYSARQSGTDHSTLEILDVERGSVLPDDLRAGFHAERPNYKAAFWYRFGATRSLDDEVFVAAWDTTLSEAGDWSGPLRIKA
jgi:prolyl oligopeptidase